MLATLMILLFQINKLRSFQYQQYLISSSATYISRVKQTCDNSLSFSYLNKELLEEAHRWENVMRCQESWAGLHILLDGMTPVMSSDMSECSFVVIPTALPTTLLMEMTVMNIQ